jgi:RNA polymerase sigma factor (sigma-70 family)
MSDGDDHDLLAQYARGARDCAEAAFTALAERHLNLVYSTALRSVGNAHAAEEISQAVFLILADKAGKLSRRVVLSGWLYQTTRLTAANFLRGEIRRQKREQEAFMHSSLNESANETWTHIAPVLDDALARLGARDRDAIVLRFFENKSLREVGTALGASEDAAKMRVNRALEKLRKMFAKRGATFSAAAIAGAISTNSVHATPAGLAKVISAVAITKGAAAGGSTLALAKGALKLMAWTKAKTAVVASAILVLAAGTTMVVVKHYNHHSRGQLPLTPTNLTLFTQESNKLVDEAKMAGLACFIFAVDHKNKLPSSFAELNAWQQQTKLSDTDWEFCADGDKDSFANPSKTIYFLEKEPRQSPDGKFFRVYATVDGRVFLVTSPDEDFTAIEKQRGFLIQKTQN